MTSPARKIIQLVLALVLVAATLRVAIIFYERSRPIETRRAPERESSYKIASDDYVAPPKVFPYDLKWANKELSDKVVWVRAGNQLPYYSYSAAARHVDLRHKSR